MKMNDVIYVKADKGNCVVLMDKKDYDERVNKLISDGPYIECKFKNGKPKNPLPEMVEQASECANLVAEIYDDHYLKRRLTVSNPKIPTLYCLPKIHKNPLKMRPIASNIDSPMEKLADFALEILNKYPIKCGFGVKNSIDFTQKIKDNRLKRGEINMSVDIENLYPSVPVNEGLAALEEHLVENRASPEEIKIVMTIARTSMNQNFFTFRNKIYKQTFGLAMGNKLSPFIANIFLSKMEEKMRVQPWFPRVWWRYMDDVYGVIRARGLQQLMNALNQQHPSIKFTYEIEEEGSLPFLDLKIHHQEDHSLRFTIYRKPTSTDRYITNDSFHHGCHKASAFHAMVYRMLNIPLDREAFEEEKQRIYSIAAANGYNNKFIDKILKHHLEKKERENMTTLQPLKEPKKRISVPYFPAISNKLQHVLKKYDIDVVVSSQNTLKSKLCNYKDQRPTPEKSGIYSVKCNDCSSVYIGQTRRPVSTRLQEHFSAVTHKRTLKSSVAAHMVHEGHTVDEQNSGLIKTVRKQHHLDAWESLYIQTATVPLMNSEEAPIISDLFNLAELKW